MFKYFEGLVDPYSPYIATDTPPRRLWPFLADYIRPFRKVFVATAVVIAATLSTETPLRCAKKRPTSAT